jgi:glucose-1-phosphate thymidylyltransferase
VIDAAVVLAAGEGRRLRPLTERWAKPLLPVDGRPVIATLLRELAAAGVARVTVVTGHLADQVESLAGAPGAFGLDVRFVRQPRPDGSADALLCGLRAGASPPLLALAADTVFTPGDVGRFAAAFARSDAAGAIAVRRDPPPAPPHRVAVRVEAGRVTRVLDDDPANPLAGAPLWALRDPIVPLLARDAPPYELGRAFQRAVDEGMTVLGVEIGPTRDLTHPVDLIQENFAYLRAVH